MLFILMGIVVALLFCTNSTFELVVDCVRVGLKKRRGVEGVRRPPRRGGCGAPHLLMSSLSREEKALKRDYGVSIISRIIKTK